MKLKNSKNFFSLLLGIIIGVIILFIFRPWLSIYPLASGDWLYKYSETLVTIPLFPNAWDQAFNNGFGGNIIFLLALNTYYHGLASILFNIFQIPWIFSERILWFWPFVVISSTGAFFLFRKIFVNSRFAVIASLIYATNTYALMLGSGGQLGVGMGYAFASYVFWGFFSVVDAIEQRRNPVRYGFYLGVAFSLQLLFDPRIAYITACGVFLCFTFFLLRQGRKILTTTNILSFAVIPFFVTLLLHFFWLMPFIMVRQNPLENLGAAYIESGIVKYLSFATFENTFSLLHPNWPENIFGKAYFMRIEFLLLPILAFCSLLFMHNKERKNWVIITFVSLGLLAAFLAKGANDPFGNIYIWLFDTIPGFRMFRDSTKWYALIAVSFSVLIPYGLLHISRAISSIVEKSKIKNQKSKIQWDLSVLVFFLFIGYWLFTIRPAVFGQLTGTFRPKPVYNDYTALTEFLHQQPGYFRTLWVPAYHHFTYYSTSHPMVGARDFFQEPNILPLTKKITDSRNLEILREASIKYVIVPHDTEEVFFLKDRIYDEVLYRNVVQQLKNVPHLRMVGNFGKIVVFAINNPYDHFWISNSKREISWQMLTSVHYQIELENGTISNRLIFSEAFDRNWIARIGGKIVRSEKYHNRYNSFLLQSDGIVDVEYEPQKLVEIGKIVSLVSAMSLVVIMIIIRRKYD